MFLGKYVSLLRFAKVLKASYAAVPLFLKKELSFVTLSFGPYLTIFQALLAQKS